MTYLGQTEVINILLIMLQKPPDPEKHSFFLERDFFFFALTTENQIHYIGVEAEITAMSIHLIRIPYNCNVPIYTLHKLSNNGKTQINNRHRHLKPWLDQTKHSHPQ